ncbi:HAD family phosphatase [Spirulina sp. CS-785/01]|uniref:HAD family hydrolase n=1 Tax=Spirulina sp. CS-785/01 TaxID=3021716 RepID=UPI0023300779|nr:HAD family phosphatase [Spirulina sp. CS-785/01]MDB9315967.1 HAD family phosphatase [Spirulina sp. CS-785/01]
MNLKAVDAIIFDIGGVILNIEYNKTIAALRRVSQLDIARLYSQYQQSSLFDDVETGKISGVEFLAGLKSLLHCDCADAVLLEAWNAMLLDIPPERIELLASLRHHKRTFALSNTNELHAEAFEGIYEQTTGQPRATFAELFEQVYYSHVLRDRKPNPTIFQRVLKDNQLTPERTLFIDDSPQHIKSAKTVGLQTLHLTGGKSLLDLDWPDL